jgi:predicted nucleic acid-binding protein
MVVVQRDGVGWPGGELGQQHHRCNRAAADRPDRFIGLSRSRRSSGIGKDKSLPSDRIGLGPPPLELSNPFRLNQLYRPYSAIEEADQPTLEEVLERAGGRSGGSVPLRDASPPSVTTVIVADASVLVVALADGGPDGDLARARLHGERLTVPELADLEVTSVLRRQMKAGMLDARRPRLAFDDLVALSARRAPHRSLLARCWELRDNLTIYDAAYVALAEALGTTLLTGDQKLARAPDAPSRSSSLHPEHFVRAGGLSGGVAS